MNDAQVDDPRDVLVETSKRLAEIGRELGLERLASTIEADTRRRLQDQHVRAMILGEIKHGKSTLINALCRTDVLPTGVTPTTGAVVLVQAGTGPGLYLDKGNDKERLDPGRFEALARGPKRGEAPEPALLEGNLEVVLDSDRLPPALQLVDTPGINDIATFRAAVSRGELPRADILVLVLDATQLLNRTEMVFLRDAVSSVGGLDDSGAKLLITINRIDLVAPDDRKQLVEYLERELAALAPRGSDGKGQFEIFSTDARSAARDPDGKDPGIEGVRQLRERLFALASRRSELLPSRVRSSLLRHTTLLGHNAAVAARAIMLELDILRREIDTLEKEFAADSADMTALRAQMAEARERLLLENEHRTHAFRQTLQDSIQAAIGVASLRTLSVHLPGSIHDAFLAFAQEEAERLRVSLDEVTRKAIHTHSEQVRRRLFQATMRLGFRGPTVYLDPPSFVLEAGLVAIGIAGTAVMYFGNLVAGMLMTVAGPLATVFLRERSLRDTRERAAAELPGALDRAEEALREQVRNVVDGHLAALDEHLLLANVALREQLEGVLRRAAAELDPPSEPSSPEAITRRRAAAQQNLQRLERELEAIRKRLHALPL